MDLRKITCPDCGMKVVPWEDFPKNLRALVSCSVGVRSYVTEEEYQEARQSTPIFGVDYDDSDDGREPEDPLDLGGSFDRWNEDRNDSNYDSGGDD